MIKYNILSIATLLTLIVKRGNPQFSRAFALPSKLRTSYLLNRMLQRNYFLSQYSTLITTISTKKHVILCNVEFTNYLLACHIAVKLCSFWIINSWKVIFIFSLLELLYYLNSFIWFFRSLFIFYVEILSKLRFAQYILHHLYACYSTDSFYAAAS